MKYIITESQYNKTIDKFISYQLEPHEEKSSKEKPKSKFWVKDGKVIAELNKKNNEFYLHFDIWHMISLMFSLENDETKEVMRQWLKEHYNLSRLTPFYYSFPHKYTLY
jgi:hypothetical protein